MSLKLSEHIPDLLRKGYFKNIAFLTGAGISVASGKLCITKCSLLKANVSLLCSTL